MPSTLVEKASASSVGDQTAALPFPERAPVAPVGPHHVQFEDVGLGIDGPEREPAAVVRPREPEELEALVRVRREDGPSGAVRPDQLEDVRGAEERDPVAPRRPDRLETGDAERANAAPVGGGDRDLAGPRCDEREPRPVGRPGRQTTATDPHAVRPVAADDVQARRGRPDDAGDAAAVGRDDGRLVEVSAEDERAVRPRGAHGREPRWRHLLEVSEGDPAVSVPRQRLCRSAEAVVRHPSREEEQRGHEQRAHQRRAGVHGDGPTLRRRC